MIEIKDTFNKELKADPDVNNNRRKVLNAHFSYVTPKKVKNAKLIHVSDVLINDLNWTDFSKSEAFLNIFSGNQVLENTKPFSMCYGGHQFGQWAGQLGDGRAINLFEINHHHQQLAFQLKGAGETPYSRNADGLAVLRSSIREHLCSEAMFHLGVPTTRSLSLISTGDAVLRDMMYDGHPEYEKGAIVCRVAPSFIRFGNFELLASRNDIDNLKILADYTIKYYFPEFLDSENKYLMFYEKVCQLTLSMIVDWYRVGFVHGVMNTDNFSILGLTIDYGPYGWLEDYNPSWTPNTTDNNTKRYQFAKQAEISHWNLFQLANAMFPLINSKTELENILNQYPQQFKAQYHQMMMKKLGLFNNQIDDVQLIKNIEKTMEICALDYTIFFRNLAKIDSTTQNPYEMVKEAIYPHTGSNETLLSFLEIYQNRLKLETLDYETRVKLMNAVNPKYVLRNYMSQMAIEAANNNDYSLVKELYELLKQPYNEQIEHQKWFAKRPEWANNKIGCSALSCSS